MRPFARHLTALTLVLAAGTTQAAVIPVNAAAGLSAPADTTLDFNTLSGFLGLSFQPSPEVEISGLSLTGFTGGGFPGISGRWINAGGNPDQAANTTTISFLGTVTGAAIRIATNLTAPSTGFPQTMVTALLNGMEVGSYSLQTSTNIAANWIGFEGMAFDTLRILPGGQNGAHHLDNLQFSGFQPTQTSQPASAPATVMLLLAGLAGAFARGRATT